MEDFVTLDLAVELKEKGFNIPFYFFYRTDDKLLHHANITNPLVYGGYIDDEVIIAPTISQVLNWLRKEKGIYVALDFFRFNGNTEIWWTYSIRYIKDDSTEDIFDSCKQKSWEQAALAGIEYVLENII